MKMYLVYEKNYLNYEEIDCVEEADMKLWQNKKDAIDDMELRKRKYIAEQDFNEFTFMPNESSDECFVFADKLHSNGDDRDGEFHICLCELTVN